MLHAMTYLALLLLLLLLARKTSTKFMPFMVQISNKEFVHSKALFLDVPVSNWCAEKLHWARGIEMQPRTSDGNFAARYRGLGVQGRFSKVDAWQSHWPGDNTCLCDVQGATVLALPCCLGHAIVIG
jgi:hypothetical protein